MSPKGDADKSNVDGSAMDESARSVQQAAGGRVRRRDLLNFVATGTFVGVSGCSSVLPGDDSGLTNLGDGGPDDTAPASCPDTLDLLPPATPEIVGLSDPRDTVLAKVGDGLVVPQLQIDLPDIRDLSLEYELTTAAGEEIGHAINSYALTTGTNHVPPTPRNVSLDYEEDLLDVEVGETPGIDAELTRSLQAEGTTLTIECRHCDEDHRIERDVRFVGTHRDLIEPESIELTEHRISELDDATNPGNVVLTTSWGVIWTWEDPESGAVGVYVNGEQFYEYAAVASLIRLPRTDKRDGIAIRGVTAQDTVEIVQYFPEDGETKWPAKGIYSSSLMAAGGEPVWSESEPVQLGYTPPARFDHERSSSLSALLRAGEPIAWAGPWQDGYATIRTNIRPLFGPADDDVWAYLEILEASTDVAEWRRKWILWTLDEYGGSSSTLLTQYPADEVGPRFETGELLPFEIDDDSNVKFLDLVHCDEGDSACRSGPPMFRVVTDEHFAVIGPTTNWEQFVVASDGRVRVIDVSATATGVAMVIRDTPENGESQDLLFWDGWQSEWGSEITLNATSGLAKPVWTRTDEANNRTTMYGEDHLTDDFVGGRTARVVPYHDGDELAYPTQREVTNGMALSQVCQTGEGVCGPWYRDVELLGAAPYSGVAYVGSGDVDRRFKTQKGGAGEHVPIFHAETVIVTQDQDGARERIAVPSAGIERRAEVSDRFVFWGRTAAVDRAERYRLHVYTGTDYVRSTGVYDHVDAIQLGEPVVESGITRDDTPFIGSFAWRETADGLAAYLVSNKDVDLTEPVDEDISSLTDEEREAIAAESANEAFLARAKQLETEWNVCNLFQEEIRTIGPIEGTDIQAALYSQSTGSLSAEERETIVGCAQARLNVQIAAPLLVDLGNIILAGVDFVSFVNGISPAFRGVIEATGKAQKRLLIKGTSKAALEITQKAADIIVKKATGYPLPDPDIGGNVAEFWTKIALDLATEKQKQVIEAFLEDPIFVDAKRDLEWIAGQMREFEDSVENYRDSDSDAGRKAAIIGMIEVHTTLQERKEQLATEMQAYGSFHSEFKRDMPGL